MLEGNTDSLKQKGTPSGDPTASWLQRHRERVPLYTAYSPLVQDVLQGSQVREEDPNEPARAPGHIVARASVHDLWPWCIFSLSVRQAGVLEQSLTYSSAQRSQTVPSVLIPLRNSLPATRDPILGC